MNLTFTPFLNYQGKPRVRFAQREFLPAPLLGETLAGYVYRACQSFRENDQGKFGAAWPDRDRFLVAFDGCLLILLDSTDESHTSADFTGASGIEDVFHNAFDLCISKVFPEYALKFKEENGVAVLEPNHTPKLP